ncbi:MAG TPA: hypothetical protein VGG64_07705 [Pirellulales bacterium]
MTSRRKRKRERRRAEATAGPRLLGGWGSRTLTPGDCSLVGRAIRAGWLEPDAKGQAIFEHVLAAALAPNAHPRVQLAGCRVAIAAEQANIDHGY